MQRDIGNLAVPVTILTKHGRLTANEWNLLRSHSVRGHDILEEASVQWPVAEMALRHQERLDGAGYPDSLKGDSLGFESRLLAVCNVVEPMSSHRPCWPTSSLASVWQEMRAGKGRLYDARVVDVLEDIHPGRRVQTDAVGWFTLT